ncbi:MAG TPA: hypothetical protein VFZ37_06570 [Jiangellaceae bacterium]
MITGTPAPRLFHFSEEPDIAEFAPRKVRHRPDVPPLVWTIDEPHQFMYMFPRECPRILLWPLPTSAPEDVAHWFGRSDAQVIAYVEYGWLERMRSTTLYRYDMPPASFTDLGDAGAWVSEQRVVPTGVEPIDDIFTALEIAAVELRVLPRLTPLVGLWETTTLHWSAIRMRNAQDWPR